MYIYSIFLKKKIRKIRDLLWNFTTIGFFHVMFISYEQPYSPRDPRGSISSSMKKATSFFCYSQGGQSC